MTAIRPPEQLRPIVELIGEEAALRLVQAYGGVRIEVPSRATPHCVLAQQVGLPATQALVKEFGGCRLSLPLCKPWRAQLMVAQGSSTSEVARALHITEWMVRKYKRQAGLEGRQPMLPGLV